MVLEVDVGRGSPEETDAEIDGTDCDPTSLAGIETTLPLVRSPPPDDLDRPSTSSWSPATR